MSSRTARTVRKDLTILTSLALLGLVALAALTGFVMDDAAEEFLPVDDIHPLIGLAMTCVACVHVLLQVGPLSRYVRKRLDDLTRGSPPRVAEDARSPVDWVPLPTDRPSGPTTRPER
jgi:hypothetical protein